MTHHSYEPLSFFPSLLQNINCTTTHHHHRYRPFCIQWTSALRCFFYRLAIPLLYAFSFSPLSPPLFSLLLLHVRHIAFIRRTVLLYPPSIDRQLVSPFPPYFASTIEDAQHHPSVISILPPLVGELLYISAPHLALYCIYICLRHTGAHPTIRGLRVRRRIPEGPWTMWTRTRWTWSSAFHVSNLSRTQRVGSDDCTLTGHFGRSPSTRRRNWWPERTGSERAREGEEFPNVWVGRLIVIRDSRVMDKR